MTAMTHHVGHAGRTQEKFRYPGDPNEVTLRISAEAANDVLLAIRTLDESDHPISTAPLRDIATALIAMGLTY